MKICKICNNEITNKKKLVYCSDECAEKAKLINIEIKKNIAKEKFQKDKANWKHIDIEIGEVKHNNLIPLNSLDITNSIKTHLKLLLRESNLSKKEYVKMKRLDGVVKDFLLVVVNPDMIKEMFNYKYDVYKKNFRWDCLRTVKTLARVFDLVNNYDFTKAKNAK